jgi:hypothetical protein
VLVTVGTAEGAALAGALVGDGDDPSASAGPAPSNNAAQARPNESKGFLRIYGFSLAGPPPQLTAGSVVIVRRDEPAPGPGCKGMANSRSPRH